MIIVFGSINMDMFIDSDRMPEVGETVVCPSYETSPGGKGANQALAALRAGAKVALVGRSGDDGMGTRIVTNLRREGVMTSGVAQSSQPTGCAIILRGPHGENRIIVASGANAEVSADQVPDEILKPGNVVLMQMETPPEENWKLLERAKKLGAMTILNAAPARPIPKEVFPLIDVLIINEIEARQLTGQMDIKADTDVLKQAAALSSAGPLTCIITLGAKGSVAWTKENKPFHVPALKIDEVVDTTGAGDAWCGTLATALYQGIPLEDAMKRASVAASLSCMKKGAHESFPYLGDIEDNLSKL
jgi:ribokinase